MARDVDGLMWTKHPCPGCGVPVTAWREYDLDAPVRLCAACHAWQNVERARLGEGLPPAIENNLGADPERDNAAQALLDQWASS
jgi:hypothetical protein